MKFKVIPGNELFDKFQKIRKDWTSANEAAGEWIEKNFGEDIKWAGKLGVLGGGIGGINFDKKPDGFCHVGKKWHMLFMPYARNKKMWKEIDSLPVVEMSVLKDLLKYGNYSGASEGGLFFSTYPGILIKDDVVLIDVIESITEYTPVPNMIEILISEYNQLSKPEKSAK